MGVKNQAADANHPSFSKLFVETQVWVPEVILISGDRGR
jgi:hypothetical protein